MASRNFHKNRTKERKARSARSVKRSAVSKCAIAASCQSIHCPCSRRGTTLPKLLPSRSWARRSRWSLSPGTNRSNLSGAASPFRTITSKPTA